MSTTTTFERKSTKGIALNIMRSYGVFLTEEEYDKTTLAQMNERIVELKTVKAKEDNDRYLAKLSKKIIPSVKTNSDIIIDGVSYQVYGRHFSSKELANLFINEPAHYEKKKEQITIRQINSSNILYRNSVKGFVVREGSADEIVVPEFPTSESRMLRYNPVEKIGPDNLPYMMAEDFIIINFNDEPGKQKNNATITALLYKGFEFEGKTWLPVLRSPSQSRQYKLVFTSLNPSVVRYDLTMGADFADAKGMVSPAKKDAYPGNALSSSKVVGSDYTHAIVADYRINVTVDTKTWDGEPTSSVVEERLTLDLCPTDGQGTVRPVAAARIAYRYGIISKSDYIYFMKNFKSINELYEVKDLPETERLLSIFKRIPKGFQLRPAGIKGFVVMYDHDIHGFDCDFVFTESMVKYLPADKFITDIDVEILAYSKTPKTHTRTYYQQLQSLNLTNDNIVTLGENALNYVRGVYSDPRMAKQFLGLIRNIGDDEVEFDTKLVSKLCLMLETCDDVLYDSYFQRKLRDLTLKYVQDIMIGRVPIEGQYAYIVTDPAVIFGAAPALKAGEYYYNGIEDSYSISRAPISHYSQIIKIDTVQCEQYWYLNDILVLNVYDDTLPRMGGADTDGDKVLMSKEPIIINAVYPKSPMLYDAGKSGIKVQDTDSVLLEFWSKNAAPFERTDNIGSIANQIACQRDWAIHCNDMKTGNEIIEKLGFSMGWVIDSAKTGFDCKVQQDLKTNKLPHWLEHVKVSKGREINREVAECYISDSPLGKLYDLGKKFMEENITNKELQRNAIPNATMMFALSMNHELVDVYYPIIKQYERNYRQELKVVYDNSDVLSKEECDDLYTAIIDRYSSLMSALPCDEMTKAGLAYQLSYKESKARSTSFPWLTCFEGMIELLQYNCKNNRVYKLPKPFLLDTSVNTLFVYDGVIYTNTGDIINIEDVTIEDGEYPVFVINGLNYFVSPIVNETDYSPIFAKLNGLNTVAYEKGQLIQISATGFKYNDLNASEALKLIQQNDMMLDIRLIDQRAMLYVGSRKIGIVGKTDTIDPSFLNAKVKVVHAENPIGLNAQKLQVVKAYIKLDVEYVDVLHDSVVSESVSVGSYDTSADPYVELYDVIKITSNPIVIGQSAQIAVQTKSMDTDVLVHVNTNAPYWNEMSLCEPSTVKSYSLGILNVQPIKGEDVTVIAEMKVTSHSDKVYTYTVSYVMGVGFVLSGSPKPSAEFEAWMFRMVSYTCAEKRLSK